MPRVCFCPRAVAARFPRELPRIGVTFACAREFRCVAPERERDELDDLAPDRRFFARVFCDRVEADLVLLRLPRFVRRLLVLRLEEAVARPRELEAARRFDDPPLADADRFRDPALRERPLRLLVPRREPDCFRELDDSDRALALRRFRDDDPPPFAEADRRRDPPDRLALAEPVVDRDLVRDPPRDRPRCALALLSPSARVWAVSREINLLKLLFSPRAVDSWCSNANPRSSNFSNQSSHDISSSLSSPV